LYGAGLRLSECLLLRNKDIDFGFNQITIYDGKGAKDRITLLPESIIPQLKEQIKYIEHLHIQDFKKKERGYYTALFSKCKITKFIKTV